MPTAHKIQHTTRTGAFQIYRLLGAPDCDSAAMFVAEKFGGTITEVTAIEHDAPRVWGEQTIGEWVAPTVPRIATLTISVSRKAEARLARHFLADRNILSEIIQLGRGHHRLVMHVPSYMGEESARRILRAATPTTHYIADWKDGTTA